MYFWREKKIRGLNAKKKNRKRALTSYELHEDAIHWFFWIGFTNRCHRCIHFVRLCVLRARNIHAWVFIFHWCVVIGFVHSILASGILLLSFAHGINHQYGYGIFRGEFTKITAQQTNNRERNRVCTTEYASEIHRTLGTGGRTVQPSNINYQRVKYIKFVCTYLYLLLVGTYLCLARTSYAHFDFGFEKNWNFQTRHIVMPPDCHPTVEV